MVIRSKAILSGLMMLVLMGTGACLGEAGRVGPRAPQLAFVGDVLLADRVERYIRAEGPERPFAGVQEIFSRADLVVINLECPLSTKGRPADKRFTFRGHPEMVKALQAAGVGIASLANNHSVDYGTEALLETIETLRGAGIEVVGAGANLAEASRPLILVLGRPPRRIAFLAFSNMLPISFYATENRPGTNPAWPEAITAQVAAARKEADVVVAMFHWGDENRTSPTTRQRRLAETAVRAGADLVVGHHPHVLQGLEVKGDSFIAYSLGNFLFPSRGEARRTAVLLYTPLLDGGALVEVVPCTIDDFRPQLAEGSEREVIIQRLRELSGALGKTIPDWRGRVLLSADGR